MANEDLESFRKQWLSELGTFTNAQKSHQDEREKTKNKETRRKSLPVKTNQSQTEHSSSSSSSSSAFSKKQQEYEAFTIANKYLKVVGQNHHCRYCKLEQCKKRVSVNDCAFECSKRKCLDNNKSGEDSPSSSAKKNKQSLVDLLIADIDAITSIPFFELELPKEIAVKVFTYLPITDLAHCCLVNKQWKTIAEDDLIWFNIFERMHLNKGGALNVVDRDHWKALVKEEVLRNRFVQQKWKERLCEVRDLQYEKGSRGVMYLNEVFFKLVILAFYLKGRNFRGI